MEEIVIEFKDHKEIIEIVSLRDYFAAKAMQGLILKLPLLDRDGEFSKNYNQEDICKIHSDVSLSAYCYADAMLLAREK